MNIFKDEINNHCKDANRYDNENGWIQEHSNSLSEDDIDYEDQAEQVVDNDLSCCDVYGKNSTQLVLKCADESNTGTSTDETVTISGNIPQVTPVVDRVDPVVDEETQEKEAQNRVLEMLGPVPSFCVPIPEPFYDQEVPLLKMPTLPEPVVEITKPVNQVGQNTVVKTQTEEIKSLKPKIAQKKRGRPKKGEGNKTDQVIEFLRKEIQKQFRKKEPKDGIEPRVDIFQTKIGRIYKKAPLIVAKSSSHVRTHLYKSKKPEQYHLAFETTFNYFIDVMK